LLKVAPVKDENGVAMGLVGTMTDLTDIKNIHQTLSASEARFRAIIEAVPVPLALNDEQGNITYLNKAFIQVVGYTTDDIPNLEDWWPRAYPNQQYRKHVADAWQSNMENAKRTGKPFAPMEVAICCKNGMVRTFLISPASLEESFARNYLVILYDITERKMLEDSIRFRQFSLDHTGEEVFWIDKDAHILDANEPACRKLGYTHEEICGLTVADVDAYFPIEKWPEHWQELKNNKTLQFESFHKCRNGKIFPIEIVANYFEYEGLEYNCALVRDITARKLAEEALRESETLLRESQIIADLGSYVLDIPAGFWKSSEVLDKLFGIDEAYERSVEGWAALICHDDRAMMENYFRNEVLGQGNSFDKEYRIIRIDDQTERWVHGLGKLEFDAQGHPLKMYGTIQDITEHKKREEQLRQSEEKLRAYLDNISDTIWLIDSSLNISYVSPNVKQLLDVLPEELIGRPSDVVIHPDDIGLIMNAYRYVVEHFGEPHTIEYRVRHKDGRCIYVESTSVNMLDNPEINGVLVSMRNITERKQAEIELRIAATAFESQEGIFVTDAHNVILRINRAFTKITGYSAEEVLGKNPRIFQSGRHDVDFYAAMWESINRTDAWEGEIWNRRKNGEIYPEYLIISAVKDQDGIIRHYVATFNDITTSKADADKIERLAFYDPLTGLPNRRLLWERLKLALASSNRSGRKGALLFIDMDNFKTLNDSHGHDIGDLLLQQVAQRLEFCVREGDTVVRLGGDEFVVMLEDLSVQALEAAAQTEVIGNKILAALNQPYQLATHNYHSTPSIGATLFIGHEQSIEELLKQADIAMYQAKSSGRNALRFFDPKMQASITARVALEADLHLALAENQFELYFQAQVCHNRQVIGAEVLIRWQHPLRGLVSPEDFIPLAEETGLILPIGQWVLETACAQIKIWAGFEHTRHLQLAVNVSARQFRQANFVEQVSQVLRRNAINPDRLKLELTESLVLDDIDDSVYKMHALRKIGVRFSIDDFGTGYSSLSYLTQLPLDQLKIDQSFIHNIGIKTTDAVIVQTIIGMANNVGLEVIAEGVETEVQRIFLEQHDCQICQGYLFSKPLPIEQFESLQKQI
jgi:diguanylate cyclase (GGDEF)-like protein/PAS domain S-box-containing protein